MMDPAPGRPRIVLLLAAAALALLCDPCWLDFEAARRALLSMLLGAGLVLAPRAFAARAVGDRWLLAFLGWTAIAALVNGGGEAPADGVMRWFHWLALLLLLRLAAATGADAWQRTAAALLPIAAAIGLLQKVGVLNWLGNAAEPVSTFGNRNVAAEFTAIAGAAVALLMPRHPRLCSLGLVLAGAYSVANGSRSALVALPIALVFVAATTRDRSVRSRWLPLALAAIGAALGLLLPTTTDPAAASQPATQPAGPTANAAAPSLGVATVEVRLEIAKSGLHMLAAAPVCGLGPGQFAVAYPRYRSPEEIELSSLGRAEYRRVATAHDDWLEVAIEGGAPALLLLLGYVASRWRAARDRRHDLAPLVALGLLMVVRAPLGNAPAVALALLTAAGAAAPAMPASTSRGNGWRRGLGLLLLGVGVTPLLGAFCTARAIADLDAPAAASWLEAGTAIHPFDPTAWQLRAALQRRIGSPASTAAALEALDRAIALRPHEPSYRSQRADCLRLLRRFDEAKRELAEVARLDPGDPQVNVQLAGIYFTQRDVEGTLAALTASPPPSLRRQLVDRLDEFAALAHTGGDEPAALRFLAEAAFVRALDATGHAEPRAQALAAAHFETMRQAFQAASLHEQDLREYIVLGLLSLDAGNEGTARDAARAAKTGKRALQAWQWSLLREPTQRLRALPEWQALLPLP